MAFEAASSAGPIALQVDRMPDTIDMLGEGGQDRLRKLRLRNSDLNKVVPKWDDTHTATMARIEAEQRLTRLREHPSRGGFGLANSDPRTIAAAKRVEELVEAEKRLADLQTVRAQTWREASHTLSAVEAFLKNRPGGTVLQDFETPEPKLNKNENLLAAIERHQQNCRGLRTDLQKIRSSPYPSEHCRAKAKAEIEAMAARGAIGVGRMVAHNGDLDWPVQQVRVSVHNAAGATGFAESIDTAALLAWVHKDSLLARVDAEIEAQSKSNDKAALSVEARRTREAELLTSLLAAERDLCAIIWRAQSENLPAEFTADINPVAILGVELVAVLAVPSSGTTRGMSWAHG